MTLRVHRGGTVTKGGEGDGEVHTREVRRKTAALDVFMAG